MGVFYDCWVHPAVCGGGWGPGVVWGGYPEAAVRVFFEENRESFTR